MPIVIFLLNFTKVEHWDALFVFTSQPSLNVILSSVHTITDMFFSSFSTIFFMSNLSMEGQKAHESVTLNLCCQIVPFINKDKDDCFF
jgi:hypothetical protein